MGVLDKLFRVEHNKKLLFDAGVIPQFVSVLQTCIAQKSVMLAVCGAVRNFAATSKKDWDRN